MPNRPAEQSAAFELPDVGLYVDDERSIAAVSRPSRANPSLHIASLHRTVLYLHADGSASLGGTDDPDAYEYSGFVDGGDATDFAPGDLVAMTLRCLLAEVAGSVGTEPSQLAAAATFPSRWTAEQVSAVRAAMNDYGLGHVALVPESEALAAWAESTQATWAGSDSGIAAARGAASIAGEYPVDAVTEEIALARPASPAAPLWTRTPVLAAVAFAAVLALGGGVAALVLQNSSAPTVPEIEGAPMAANPTTSSTPTSPIPFPTVVPILEPVAPAVVPAQPAEPTRTSDEPTEPSEPSEPSREGEGEREGERVDEPSPTPPAEDTVTTPSPEDGSGSVPPPQENPEGNPEENPEEIPGDDTENELGEIPENTPAAAVSGAGDR